MSTFLEQFAAARRVSTPLIAVRTPDPAATIAGVTNLLTNNGKEPPPMLAWDIVRSLRAVNEAGVEAAARLSADAEASGDGLNPASAILNNPREMLAQAAKLPAGTLLFIFQADLYIENEAVRQAVWNLRDPFKSNKRTLVLLCPDITLPPHLSQDVLVLDEPLPDGEALKRMIGGLYNSAGIELPGDAAMDKAVSAVAGLAAFPAEQAAAMSLTKKGINIDTLWDRKRQMIEQTPGLSVWRGGEKFSDIGGVQNVKDFLTAVIGGKRPPKVIVFLDEVEKGLAGATGSTQDNTGVSQGMLGAMLTEMEDTEAAGLIFVGPPGCAKSVVAKAAGNEAGRLTIAWDLQGTKASLVGQTEARVRSVFKVIRAVGQGEALYIATCNEISVLPPPLRRRFKFGSFFFDLPTAEEREKIWPIYLSKYGLTAGKKPIDDGWTGAEIRNCCEVAWRLGVGLKQAAAYVVPVAVSAADQINRLRKEASGRYISASRPGIYRVGLEAQPEGRKLEV